jgi:hypothetical protein
MLARGMGVKPLCPRGARPSCASVELAVPVCSARLITRSEAVRINSLFDESSPTIGPTSLARPGSFSSGVLELSTGDGQTCRPWPESLINRHLAVWPVHNPGYLDPGYQATPPGSEPAVISQVAYFLDDTTKTRAVWEINKGVNIEAGKIGVNDFIAQEDRRVPIPNMIYVADGPTDVPIFSILNQYGGRTLGVYNPAQDAHFLGAKRLREQGRVQEIVEADYRPKTTADRWITAWIQEIANVIVENRERAMKDRVHAPGGHVTD